MGKVYIFVSKMEDIGYIMELPALYIKFQTIFAHMKKIRIL